MDVSARRHVGQCGRALRARLPLQCTIVDASHVLLSSRLRVLTADGRLSQEEPVFRAWFPFCCRHSAAGRAALRMNTAGAGPVHAAVVWGPRPSRVLGTGAWRGWPGQVTREKVLSIQHLAPWGHSMPPCTILCMRTRVPSVFSPVRLGLLLVAT